MEQETTAQTVLDGRTALGIELGSTRIKAILIGPDHAPLASGAYSWESRLEDGLWTTYGGASKRPTLRWPPRSKNGTASR